MNQFAIYIYCRAVARQLIAMHSQPTFVYIYIYIYVRHALGPWGPPGIQNGVSYCFVDAVFEAVVREESSIWTSLPHHFSKRGLLQLPG